MPKISVIIPVYNVEKYLTKCLDSVMNQNFSDYEVIIIDDGSTDSSGKIADEYAKKCSEKIKVIHQLNKGLGGARNTGIDNALGEYFLFLDSDDTIEANVLSELEEEITKTNAQMVIYGIKTINENGKVLECTINNQPKHKKLELELYKDIIFSLPATWNKLYHRDLFLKTGIRFPDKVWYEDIRTITKLYPCAEGISFTDGCYYEYLRRQGSIMNNSNLKRNLEILDAFEDIISYYKNSGLYESFQQELEFLAINHILIAAVVRIVKVDPKSDFIGLLIDYMEKEFPNYRSNSYIKTLAKNKKLIYYFLIHKMYKTVYWIFKVKNKL